MRLLLISLGSVFIMIVLILTARFWGLGQQYQAFEHPFLQEPLYYAIQVENLGQAGDAIKAYPRVILWIDVRISKDLKLFVQTPHVLNQILRREHLGEKFVSSKPTFYDYSLLKSYSPDLKYMSDFLSQFPEQRFILNVVDNAENIHLLLQKELAPFHPEKRILIQSDTDVIIRATKEVEPFWLYGSSIPEITRLVTFASIGLEPAISLRGDVLVTPLNIMGRKMADENVFADMKRRFKKVFLGPLQNDAEVYEAYNFYSKQLVNGFVFVNPDQLRIIDSKIAP